MVDVADDAASYAAAAIVAAAAAVDAMDVPDACRYIQTIIYLMPHSHLRDSGQD